MRKIRLAIEVWRESGPKALWHRVRKYAGKHLLGHRQFLMLVAPQDVIAADWTKLKPPVPEAKKPGPYTLNWILCPPSTAGGHTTMFRVVQYLESKGHVCRLYSYSTSSTLSIEEQQTIIKNHFPAMKAKILDYKKGMAECDAIIATGWETAYAAFNYQKPAHRFYFVQDFEPYFHPVGSQSVLAENTYRFGFKGITAGRWLADKLSVEYGMACDYFDFGSDSDNYSLKNSGNRKAVLFYARPVTERRGFELGCLALEIFNQLHPEYEIHMVGWDVGKYRLPFKFFSHGILTPQELNQLYNQCAAGLVISLTNLSLLPLEMLSAGCIPVVNDGPNNRMVSRNPYIKYALAAPHDLARAMSEVVSRTGLTDLAAEASSSVRQLSWDQAGAKVESFITKELNG